jgi:hypothetical protein
MDHWGIEKRVGKRDRPCLKLKLKVVIPFQ